MNEGFLDQLKSAIDEYDLIAKNEKVLVGVSGGPDSVALLQGLLLLSKQHRRNWRLSVVHVNHLLRGEESLADAEYVIELCRQKGVPFSVSEVDVRLRKQKEGGNTQDVARKLRYQVFYDKAQELDIKKIVLAHHADDQVETVLMRLLRGTSISGLMGMLPRRRWRGLEIIRPMLYIFRKDIEAYIQGIDSLKPRYDKSNESIAYTRNRIRHCLIPELSSYNPQVKNALLKLTEFAKSEEEVWLKLAKDAVKTVTIKKNKKDYWLDVKKYLNLPVALQRRTVKLILDCLIKRESSEITLETVERVRSFIHHQHPSAEIHLTGGILVRKEYERLHITYLNEEKVATYPDFQPIQLIVPGITKLPYFSGEIEATIADKEMLQWNSDQIVVFDAEQINQPLFVRSRKKGDRMTCFGLNGSKKIKDLFIAAKVPRRRRDRYPIVVSGDRILWIPGIRRSDIAPVSDQTRKLLTLVWRQK